jgi:hypothetical protein
VRPLAHVHAQGPAERAAFHHLLDGGHGGAVAVEVIGEAEPGVKAEDALVLLHGLHHLDAFVDGAAHGLFAPDVLAGLRRHDAHQRVPVGRRGDVDDVDVVAVQHFAEIVVALHFGRTAGEGIRQMEAVNIADGQEPRAGVGEVALPHAAHADNRLGELFARRRNARPAERLSRHDAEKADGGGSLEEIAAGGGIHKSSSSWFTKRGGNSSCSSLSSRPAISPGSATVCLWIIRMKGVCSGHSG